MKNSMDFRQNFEFEETSAVNFVYLKDDEKKLILKHRNDENIRRWMRNDKIITQKEHYDFIKKLAGDNKNFYWLVKDKKNNYLGVIYFNRVDFKNKNAYLGIYSFAGSKGAGKKLLDLIFRLAFEKAGFLELKLEVLSHNERALDFYRKAGFAEQSKLADIAIRNNISLDLLTMSVKNSITG